MIYKEALNSRRCLYFISLTHSAYSIFEGSSLIHVHVIIFHQDTCGIVAVKNRLLCVITVVTYIKLLMVLDEKTFNSLIKIPYS